ncbi:MAG: DASH family cryptochrome [Halobacteriales archaeon]|nr:DASH family cryptochrome [Halobacteriales archaeon]
MTTVLLFRDDLRLHDNPALVASARDEDGFVPAYVFDERDYGETCYGTEKTGARRAQFVRESVEDLRASLRELGGDLAVRYGKTEEVVASLVEEHDAEEVVLQTKPATEEFERERAVRKSARDEGVETRRFWTHTLHHINNMPTPPRSMKDTFTPWRKEVEANSEVRDTVEKPDALETPTFDDEIPTLEELGVEEPKHDERAALPFEGGETRALERLEEYVWERDCLREYKETRNGLVGADYSSKLSAWLARGCLSPRRVYEEVKEYEDERVSNDSTYWLVFELRWRDFFQFQFVKHGGAFFSPTGIRDVSKDWRGRGERFERWRAGATGVPFVDANMRELKATGYMSNRGRQNVASFLVDVLGVDWRLGAAYFEEKLVDYDVCSNWGNWAYQAGVGNDSRDGYFNVIKQAERYDPDGEFVRAWVREKEASPNPHEPYAPEGYDAPVVDVRAEYDRLADERG